MKRWIGIAAAAVMMFGLCACGATVNIAPANADKYTAGSAEINEPVENLEIEWASGMVTFVQGEKNTVILEEAYTGDLPEEKKMHWYLDGTTLRVRYDMTLSTGISSSKKLTVTLPKDLTLKDLDVSVASADVTADSLLTENADFDSASGEVSVSFKSALNKADFDTASGEVEVSFTEAIGELDFDSASGKVQIETANSVGKVKISTASGSVKAEFAKTPDQMNVDTASGDVEIRLPSNAEITLDVDTASGDFDSEIPFTKNGSKYISGSGKAAFDIDTASGDVRILKK